MNKSEVKSLLNKIVENERVFKVITKVVALIMRFSYITTRWKIVGKDIPDSYHREKKSFIVCHWHDRLMLTPCVWNWEKPLHVLASNHRDGRLIARVAEHFSMIPVYGSTGKGVAATRTLIKLLKRGEYVAVIPDGPRGPRHVVAPGAIAIAKITKTDILPYSFCVKRYFNLDSWDRFIWIWPFNRGVMVWGKPITAQELENMQIGDAVKLVEQRINEATEKARSILYDENV